MTYKETILSKINKLQSFLENIYDKVLKKYFHGDIMSMNVNKNRKESEFLIRLGSDIDKLILIRDTIEETNIILKSNLIEINELYTKYKICEIDI